MSTTHEARCFPTPMSSPKQRPSGRFAEIVFDRPLDHAYTYAVPAGMSLEPGVRVLAPFGQGNRPTVGFCVGLGDERRRGPSRRSCNCSTPSRSSRRT